jgi:TPR repeat protein
MSADSDSALSIERPFPGLRPFDYADHAFFFGREDQSYALYGLLGLGQFVAVVGSSGSGKSSLVRAGLLPLLQRESDEFLARGDDASAGRAWRWIELRPGHAPLSRLAEQLAELSSPAGGEDPVDRAVRRDRVSHALRRSSFGFSEALAGIEALSGRSLLVVVDQFEELFRYGGSGAELQRLREERTQFVQLLLEATSGRTPNLHVLITMRSDFIGDCAQFYGLPEAVSNCQFLVPSLTRDQREEVIMGPLAKTDAAIEPALLERLLNDAGNDLDQLPVLQHCLLRLWEAAGPSRPASPRRRLDCAHYDDIGGLVGALSRHADTILAELRGHDLAVEQVFRALSEVDKEGRATRRALGYARLRAEAGISDAELRLVVDRFRADDCSFLVPSVSAEPTLADETRIDVGHEALLRRWEKISGESRQDIGEEGQRRGWLWAEEEDGALYRAWLMLGPGARLPDLQRRWEVWCTRPRTAAWAERYGGRLPEIEQLFRDNLAEAEAAKAEAERRRLAAEEAIRRDEKLRLEQRRNRLLRLMAAGMAALAVTAAALGGWAFHLMQAAKQQEAIAEEQSTEAKNQRGIAEGLASGSYYTNGWGVKKDYAEALRWYRMAADLGSPDAEFYVGFFYDSGSSVPRDYGEALRWYRMAADQDNAAAEINIGGLYADGKGVEQDYAEALRWYRMAADQGNALAENIIGEYYNIGKGVEQDYAEALRWYRMAADQGDAAAETNIGDLSYSGHGVNQDYTEALRWYRMAADQGDAAAQYALSLAYANGRGTSPDLLQARVWMEKAAANGDEAAMGRLASRALDAEDAPSALLFSRQGLAMARRAYADHDPSDADKSDLATALGNLSWALELNNWPVDALAADDEALKLDPSALWIAVNRAHALLLLGRYDEAKAIYIEDKDKPVFMRIKTSRLNGTTAFAAAVLEDFAELRKFGVDRPEMKWIEAQFAEGTAPGPSAATKGEPSAPPE